MSRAASAGRRAAVAACLGLLAAPSAAQVPPPGDCAGAYWDLTAVFEEGDRITARVLLTRVGPGELGAAAQGHWIDAAGTTTPFQNGRSAGRFDVDATGRVLRIGSTDLDLAAATHRFAVDNDKRGVKLRVEVAASDALALPVQDGALALTVLHLGSPAEAHVWRTGMRSPRALRGWATWVRTAHRACEADLSALRIDVHRLAREGSALFVHERLVDGVSRSWLGWRDAAGTLHQRRPPRVALEAWRRDASDTRLPGRLRASGDGLRGEIAIRPAFLRLDPLDALPRLVRMLYWFGEDPRRAWADADLALETDRDLSPDAPSPPRGPALAGFTALRPVPSDLPPELPPETGR